MPIGYPLTAAETAASVTAVNYAYPPGVVDRYGFNTSPASVTAITQATSAQITVNTTGPANPFLIGQAVSIYGVSGMTQINGLGATVSALGGASGAWTITVNINSSGFSAYTSGGTISADMSAAVSAAAAVGGTVTFGAGIYLFTNVNLNQNVIFQGQGMTSTTLRCPQANISGSLYSTNLFTDNSVLDSVTFKDLTLDGNCTQAGTAGTSEVALVKLTHTNKIRFENVTFTHYAARSGGTVILPNQFFNAISIRFATQVDFVNVISTENYYEQIDVYFAPGVNGKANFERCSLINSTGGTADHTFIEVTGGHTVILAAFVLNNRSQSCINLNVPLSAYVSKCRFINEIGALGQTIAINVGQDLFPYNNNVTIEGNYAFNKSQLLALGPGQNQIVRDNIAIHSTVYALEFLSGLNSSALSTYTSVLPAYANGSYPPVALPTLGLVIEGNEIQGCLPGQAAIKLRDLSPATGFWFQYVDINDNVVATDTSYVHTFAIHFQDCDNLNIKGNFLGYGGDAILCDQTAANINIVENTFTSVQTTASDDVLFNTYGPTDVVVRDNTFTNYPRQGYYNVNFFAGVNIKGGALIEDNIGMKPPLPVNSSATTDYVIRNTRLKRGTAAPSTGNWGIGDVVYSVPATGTPQEYDCTTYGSLGTALSGVTLSGTIGAYTGTVTAGVSQLNVGMGIVIAGANPQCILTISGTTITFHQQLSATVTNAAVSLLAPTFHAAANFA